MGTITSTGSSAIKDMFALSLQRKSSLLLGARPAEFKQKEKLPTARCFKCGATATHCAYISGVIGEVFFCKSCFMPSKGPPGTQFTRKLVKPGDYDLPPPKVKCEPDREMSPEELARLEKVRRKKMPPAEGRAPAEDVNINWFYDFDA